MTTSPQEARIGLFDTIKRLAEGAFSKKEEAPAAPPPAPAKKSKKRASALSSDPPSQRRKDGEPRRTSAIPDDPSPQYAKLIDGLAVKHASLLSDEGLSSLADLAGLADAEPPPAAPASGPARPDGSAPTLSDLFSAPPSDNP